MKKPSTSKDLYVADIPFEAEEEELQKLFALCGKVRSILDERTERRSQLRLVTVKTSCL